MKTIYVPNIMELIAEGENQWNEFKSAFMHIDGKLVQRPLVETVIDITETAMSFANQDGGIIYLGVEDDGTVTGVDYKEKQIEKLDNCCNEKLVPKLIINIGKVFINDKVIIRFQVPECHVPVRSTNGKVLQRIGEHNIPTDANLIKMAKEARQRSESDNRLEIVAGWEELNRDQLSKFLKATKSYPNIPQEEALLRLGLARRRNGNIYLTLAALLLFANYPLGYHAKAGIVIRRFLGTSIQTGANINITKEIKLEPPLIPMIEDALSIISPLVPEDRTLEGTLFKNKTIPDFAWKESIINAVAHRDYSTQGGQIEVNIFDDRMEIKNPGNSLLDIDLIKQGKAHSMSRNPLIVKVLSLAGYMRDMGEGIPRMFDEMTKNGLRPPQITSEKGFFIVKLYLSPSSSKEAISYLESLSDFPLTDEQKLLLNFAYEKGKSFLNEDARKLLGLSKDQVRSHITIPLEAFGIVTRIQSGNKSFYELNMPIKWNDIKRFITQKSSKKIVNSIALIQAVAQEFDLPEKSAELAINFLKDK